MKNKKELFGWFSKKEVKEKTYTLNEVSELLEKIKVFNCGAIDKHLTSHVDKTFASWIEAKAKAKAKSE